VCVAVFVRSDVFYVRACPSFGSVLVIANVPVDRAIIDAFCQYCDDTSCGSLVVG
jgi:hypothetical protein